MGIRGTKNNLHSFVLLSPLPDAKDLDDNFLVQVAGFKSPARP